MVVGILLGLIAIFVATVGMKCMKCLEEDEVQKMRMAVIGGVIFLIAGNTGPAPLSKLSMVWFYLTKPSLAWLEIELSISLDNFGCLDT